MGTELRIGISTGIENHILVTFALYLPGLKKYALAEGKEKSRSLFLKSTSRLFKGQRGKHPFPGVS